jgi:hypothetical protein
MRADCTSSFNFNLHFFPDRKANRYWARHNRLLSSQAMFKQCEKTIRSCIAHRSHPQRAHLQHQAQHAA